MSVTPQRMIAATCVLLAHLAFCATAQARTWQALYAFGDSYTDSGAGYLDGNGPTSVVYLADGLGIPFTYVGDPKSSGKSLNFAVSGAQTGSSDGVLIRPANSACGVNEALLGRGMQTQVIDFVTRVKSGAIALEPERTLFFLAGGLNDGELPTATSIANLEGEIRQLYDAGGRYFLVALLPTKIPDFRAVGRRLNPALAKIPQDLRSKLPNAHVSISRWGPYFDKVIESPAQYHITNVVDKCAGRALWGEDPTPCATPDSYFYFHDGHPSTAVQKLVSEDLQRELSETFP
jgi:cholinesterase